MRRQLCALIAALAVIAGEAAWAVSTRAAGQCIAHCSERLEHDLKACQSRCEKKEGKNPRLSPGDDESPCQSMCTENAQKDMGNCSNRCTE
jgi:hypothetical protein